MARKTFDVAVLKDRVNALCDPKRCPVLSADDRKMAAAILSTVLHETGNYKGFMFLDVEHVTDDDGMIVDSIIPDETARRYY
jgi:hypothetical protein